MIHKTSAQGFPPLSTPCSGSYPARVFGLCERAWAAGRKSKAGKTEWIGWRNWLKSFAKSPVFAELLKANEGMYEEPFTKELEAILREANSEPKPS